MPYLTPTPAELDALHIDMNRFRDAGCRLLLDPFSKDILVDKISGHLFFAPKDHERLGFNFEQTSHPLISRVEMKIMPYSNCPGFVVYINRSFPYFIYRSSEERESPDSLARGRNMYQLSVPWLTDIGAVQIEV